MDEKTDNRSRRYIRINDRDSWKLIDEIATVDKYKNSFNQIINDALFYGLPALHAKLFGEVELSEDKFAELKEIYKKNFSDEEFYAQVIRLLKEINVNVNVSKSIVSSLFNGVKEEYSGKKISAEQYAKGAYSDTPEFIEGYEIRGLLDARK